VVVRQLMQRLQNLQCFIGGDRTRTDAGTKLHRHRSQARPAALPMECVDQNAKKPRLHVASRIELVERAPSLKERLLDKVFRRRSLIG
jgi:hypothetical protein